jgi:hypothetical protein
MCFIYTIINNINGMRYLGQTVHTCVENRFREHKSNAKLIIRHKQGDPDMNENHQRFWAIRNSKLYNAMAEHGIENFTFRPLKIIEFETDLNAAEIWCIAKYNTVWPNGYNSTLGGGSGGSLDEASIQLIKDARAQGIDTNRNEKLNGLPVHTAYRNHKTKGEQILINGHPLCESKTFTVSNYESFESTKKVVNDFIIELEKNGKKLDRNKRDPSLPKGIQEMKDKIGYRVNIVHNRKNYDRKFKSKRKTHDENKQTALKYYYELIKQLNIN